LHGTRMGEATNHCGNGALRPFIKTCGTQQHAQPANTLLGKVAAPAIVGVGKVFGACCCVPRPCARKSSGVACFAIATQAGRKNTAHAFALRDAGGPH